MYSYQGAARLGILAVGGGVVPAVEARCILAHLLEHDQWRALLQSELAPAKRTAGAHTARLRWADDYARAVVAVEAGLCVAS